MTVCLLPMLMAMKVLLSTIMVRSATTRPINPKSPVPCATRKVTMLQTVQKQHLRLPTNKVLAEKLPNSKLVCRFLTNPLQPFYNMEFAAVSLTTTIMSAFNFSPTVPTEPLVLHFRDQLDMSQRVGFSSTINPPAVHRTCPWRRTIQYTIMTDF